MLFIVCVYSIYIIDKKHDTIILPIFGIPVPFHISMIKVSDDLFQMI